MPNIIKSLIELGGDIANTQVANSAVADIFAPIASMAVGETNVGSVAPELVAGHSLVREFPSMPCNAALGLNGLANLKNLAREEEGAKFTQPLGTWYSVASKWKFIMREINAIIENGISDNELNILTNIKGRWAATEALLDDDPARSNFNNPDIAEHEQKQAYDRSDWTALQTLKSGRYEGLTGEVYAFHENFKNFVKAYTPYQQELIEFNRFDAYYMHSDTIKYLSWMRSVSFTPAEIKALHCQESGDFCATSIAGLEGKTEGITNGDIKNKRGYIGVAQMNNNSIVPAKKWLTDRYRASVKAANNEVIKTINNFRVENVQQCIWLSIGCLGHIADEFLYKRLPDPFPTCAEFKKLLFSAYNFGQGNTLNACLACSKDKAYTWSDVLPNMLDIARANYSTEKIDEVATYTPRILKRLGTDIP